MYLIYKSKRLEIVKLNSFYTCYSTSSANSEITIFVAPTYASGPYFSTVCFSQCIISNSCTLIYRDQW